MGTRHLIAVYSGGKYRVAQYGQWDGYPSGQGAAVLDFLTGADLDAFKAKAEACRWSTDEDREAAYRKAGVEPDAQFLTMAQSNKLREVAPEMHRDTGAGILRLVMEAENGLALTDTIEFAGDGLFCEYAYCIDLDAGTLEIFEGFKSKSDPIEGRFADMPTDDGSDYAPVSLVKTYPLNDLPDLSTFLAELEPDEEEAEDAA